MVSVPATLRPHTLLWVDVDDLTDQLLLRARSHPVLDTAIGRGVPGAVRAVDRVEWLVADAGLAARSVIALASEVRGVVLPAAATLIGSDAVHPVSVEMVPEDCWGDTAERAVGADTYAALCARVLDAAGHLCQSCGRDASAVRDVFTYVDGSREQPGVRTFVELEASCELCYLARHPGLANVTDRLDMALDHLAHMNALDRTTVDPLVAEASAQWRRRSDYEWRTDWSRLHALR